MPDQTWTVRAVDVEADVPSGQDSIFALVNRETTDARRYLVVRSVRVTPLGAQNTTVGLFRLSRFPAGASSPYGGGTALTPRKHDTNSSNLDASIEFGETPTGLQGAVPTLTDFRRWSDAPLWILSQPLVANNPGAVQNIRTHERGDIMQLRGDLGTTQALVIRPGNGIGLYLVTPSIPRKGMLEVVIRRQSDGATFTIQTSTDNTQESSDLPLLYIRSPSTVTQIIEIVSWTWFDSGLSTIPEYRLALVDDAVGGTAVTPVAHDTNNDALPSSIVALSGPFRAFLHGERRGVPVTWHYDPSQPLKGGAAIAEAAAIRTYDQFRYGVVRFHSLMPQGTAVESLLLLDERKRDLWDQSDPNAIGLVLRPGQGLAILQGRDENLNYSMFASWNVSMTFTHIPPPAAGGGTSNFFVISD